MLVLLGLGDGGRIAPTSLARRFSAWSLACVLSVKSFGWWVGCSVKQVMHGGFEVKSVFWC